MAWHEQQLGGKSPLLACMTIIICSNQEKALCLVLQHLLRIRLTNSPQGAIHLFL